MIFSIDRDKEWILLKSVLNHHNREMNFVVTQVTNLTQPPLPSLWPKKIWQVQYLAPELITDVTGLALSLCFWTDYQCGRSCTKIETWVQVSHTGLALHWRPNDNCERSCNGFSDMSCTKLATRLQDWHILQFELATWSQEIVWLVLNQSCGLITS